MSEGHSPSGPENSGAHWSHIQKLRQQQLKSSHGHGDHSSHSTGHQSHHPTTHNEGHI